MRVVLAFVVGVLVTRTLRIALADVLAAPLLDRENYRGRHLPTAGGLVIVFAVVVIEGLRTATGALGLGAEVPSTSRMLVLLAAVGFGAFGFVDDVLGGGDERGFRGHLGAVLQGRVTTGLCKLAGGGLLALVLASAGPADTGAQVFVDAALIALAANLANLLDLAPGRTTKFALVAYVPVAIVCGNGTTGVAIAVVMGGALALLGDDLRERLMLGDTGANVLGAVLGLGVVLATAPSTRLIVAVALLVANLSSEVVSFSRVIARVAPLRAFDALGRMEPA